MGKKLGIVSINDLELIQTDVDPRSGVGLQAEIGSLCFLTDAGTPFYQKKGVADTDWQPMASRSFIQYTNTQTNQNLNSSTDTNFNTKVQILGTEVYRSVNDFDVVGDDIKCKFDGFVIAIVDLHQYSSSVKTSAQARFKKNDVLIGPVSSCTYIRNSSGHRESSAHIMTIIPVTVNDLISINTRREARGGSVYLSDVGTSEIILMRY